MANPELANLMYKSESDPVRVSRRTAGKLLVGAIATPYAIGTREVSADGGTGNPLLDLPKPELSPKAAEWMSKSWEDQRMLTTKALDILSTSDYSPLADIAQGNHTKLVYANQLGVMPPELSTNIAGTYYSNPILDPRYCIADLSRQEPKSLPTLGLVSYLQGSALTEETAFGFLADSFFLGLTNHHFESAKGHLTIQLGHFGGYIGASKEDRWATSGQLGYIADNPEVPSKGASFHETEGPEDNVYPFSTSSTALHYFGGLNHYFEYKDSGILTLSIGASQDFTGINFDEINDFLNTPEEIGNKQFYLDVSKSTEAFFNWLSIRTAKVAAENQKYNYQLLFVDETGVNKREIEEVFPEVLNERVVQEIARPEIYLSPEKETLTVDDLIKIPIIFPTRGAHAKNGQTVFNS